MEEFMNNETTLTMRFSEQTYKDMVELKGFLNVNSFTSVIQKSIALLHAVRKNKNNKIFFQEDGSTMKEVEFL